MILLSITGTSHIPEGYDLRFDDCITNTHTQAPIADHAQGYHLRQVFVWGYQPHTAPGLPRRSPPSTGAGARARTISRAVVACKDSCSVHRNGNLTSNARHRTLTTIIITTDTKARGVNLHCLVWRPGRGAEAVHLIGRKQARTGAAAPRSGGTLEREGGILATP